MIWALAFVVLWLVVVALWPCKFGLHKWEYPGGKCEDCGIEDDFWKS